MEAYTDFAMVYDTFMDETPYELWKNRLVTMLGEDGIEDGLVLDLGCGTGTLTELLSEAGYDMIGIDFSQEMLAIAQEKRAQSGHQILYLEQDMREFELYGTVRAIVCICDSINYLLEKEDIITTFKLVNNYLDPKGLFIFDFNTVHKYRDVIGDTVIAENRDACSFIWENYYDEEECINEYDLTIFVKEEEELFRRFNETHYQRGYTLAEMKEMIQASGLMFVRAIDADTMEEPTDESERIYIMAREQGKLTDDSGNR